MLWVLCINESAQAQNGGMRSMYTASTMPVSILHHAGIRDCQPVCQHLLIGECENPNQLYHFPHLHLAAACFNVTIVQLLLGALSVMQYQTMFITYKALKQPKAKQLCKGWVFLPSCIPVFLMPK